MSAVTLNDLTLKAMVSLTKAQEVAQPYNDFGSVLGAQDELNRIENDLRDQLQKTLVDSDRLRRRVTKWEAGDREVTKTS
jgi:hypothetical protein